MDGQAERQTFAHAPKYLYSKEILVRRNIWDTYEYIDHDSLLGLHGADTGGGTTAARILTASVQNRGIRIITFGGIVRDGYNAWHRLPTLGGVYHTLPMFCGQFMRSS